jgi:hypothetical protein
MGPQGFRTVTLQIMLDPKNAANLKQFFTADAQGNPQSIFYAQSAALAGEQCLEQVFEYGLTASGVQFIEKMAWRDSVWSGAAWDI